MWRFVFLCPCAYLVSCSLNVSKSYFFNSHLQFKGDFEAWLTVSMRLIESHLLSLSSFFILHNLAPSSEPTGNLCSLSARLSRHHY